MAGEEGLDAWLAPDRQQHHMSRWRAERPASCRPKSEEKQAERTTHFAGDSGKVQVSSTAAESRLEPPWSYPLGMDRLELVYFAAEVIFSAVGSTLTRNRAANLDNFGSSIVHSSSTFPARSTS